MSRYRLVLILLIYCTPLAVGAQVLSTLPDEEQSQEGFFIYEVKLIDEFIERFNDEPGNYIRTQWKALYGTDKILTRKKLITSLFNKKQDWDNDAALFIAELTKPGHPEYLSFTDSSWYAELSCKFSFGVQTLEIPIVLHICREKEGYKWSIAGVGLKALQGLATKAMPHPASPQPGRDYIPTSAHGTDFIILHTIFAPDIEVGIYFDPAVRSQEDVRLFISLIAQGKLIFRNCRVIRYHFFGIKNWTFTAAYFKRKDTNSGWLINSLVRINDRQKAAQLDTLLHRNQ